MTKEVDESTDASGLYDPSQPGSAPHAAPVAEVEYDTIYPEDGLLVETVQALLAVTDDVTVSDGSIIAPSEAVAKAKLPSKPKASSKPAE